jgi:hypothetical protein
LSGKIFGFHYQTPEETFVLALDFETGLFHGSVNLITR